MSARLAMASAGLRLPTRCSLALSVGLALAGALRAQSGDVVVLGNDLAAGGKETIFRFDRKLGLLSETSLTGTGAFALDTRMTRDGTGVRWIIFDPLGPTTLLRVDDTGSLLPSTTLGANPVSLGNYKDGRVFALTRIPLSTPGPMYGVLPDGSVQWSSLAGPSLFNVVYPRQIAATPSGGLWIGDGTSTTSFWARPLLALIHPDTGAVIRTLELPAPGIPPPGAGDSYLIGLEGSPDGWLWCTVSGGGFFLMRTDGITIQPPFQIQGGYNGKVTMLHSDGQSRVLVVNLSNDTGNPPTHGDTLLRFTANSTGTPEAEFYMGGANRRVHAGPHRGRSVRGRERASHQPLSATPLAREPALGCPLDDPARPD